MKKTFRQSFLDSNIPPSTHNVTYKVELTVWFRLIDFLVRIKLPFLCLLFIKATIASVYQNETLVKRITLKTCIDELAK